MRAGFIVFAVMLPTVAFECRAQVPCKTGPPMPIADCCPENKAAADAKVKAAGIHGAACGGGKVDANDLVKKAFHQQEGGNGGGSQGGDDAVTKALMGAVPAAIGGLGQVAGAAMQSKSAGSQTPTSQDSGSQASPSAGAQPVQDNSSSSSNVFHIDIKIDGAGKDVHQLNEEMVATVFERLMLSQGL